MESGKRSGCADAMQASGTPAERPPWAHLTPLIRHSLVRLAGTGSGPVIERRSTNTPCIVRRRRRRRPRASRARTRHALEPRAKLPSRMRQRARNRALEGTRSLRRAQLGRWSPTQLQHAGAAQLLATRRFNLWRRWRAPPHAVLRTRRGPRSASSSSSAAMTTPLRGAANRGLDPIHRFGIHRLVDAEMWNDELAVLEHFRRRRIGCEVSEHRHRSTHRRCCNRSPSSAARARRT